MHVGGSKVFVPLWDVTTGGSDGCPAYRDRMVSIWERMSAASRRTPAQLQKSEAKHCICGDGSRRLGWLVASRAA
jgi:hypothetical protein